MAMLAAEARPATAHEQQVLARWSGWGAAWQIFDEARSDWDAERQELRSLLDETRYDAARQATFSAFYTDPAYVREIWTALERLGFEGGEVLEPGCGAGVFIGMAPANARMTGVELDPSSSALAAALYPAATIRTESFAATPFADGHFDAVVGNVPFAEVSPTDPRHNRGSHSLHNYFIIKSLSLTRPGGIVAVLTSHFTLDAQDSSARQEMSAMADLLGAVRLPTGALRRAAGTDVVTDLLVFRRRESGAEPTSTAWETTVPLERNGERVRDQAGKVVPVNRYFAEHPAHVLGEMSVSHGMYSSATLRVDHEVADTPRGLAEALKDITDAAHRARRTFVPEQAKLEARAAADTAAAEPLWDGHITAHADGRFSVAHAGAQLPMVVPRSQVHELSELLRMRDAARALLAAEATTAEDTPEIAGRRADLNGAYGAYVDRYGPINRFSLRPTGRLDPRTGEPRSARVAPPAIKTLRSDPFFALVIALENFDEATQRVTPATLLSRRVISPRALILRVDTPADALAVCLERQGRVDLATIASLLGQETAQARQALGDLVFDDPASGALLSASEYLSGDVRHKLEVARAAAERQPALAVNVAALEAVVPPDLRMDEIEPRLGASWIDAATHQQFLSELLRDESVQVEHPGAAIWEVKGAKYSLANKNEWGTPRMPATAIAKAVLEQRPIQVTTDRGDGTRVLNPVETTAAQEKAEAMQERFAEWVWEEPERASRLLREYNRRFNNLVLRDYTAEGTRLTLPGLATTFTPREHQRTAVARMINEPAVGLFHAVGAGKTAEMVMGTMELKRLGMVSKPVVVVPNHMLEQFSREWLQLYPRARILAASSQDLAREKRRQFIARTATNDWDAIIMTRGAFERLPLSRDAQAAYIKREIAELRQMLELARDQKWLTIKRLEKMVMAGHERLIKYLNGPRDPGPTFEETGIDYLVIDEMHDYKNLRTPTNIRDAFIDGSRRASDLHMKTDYLRRRHGARVITAATATPIANSITETHVMQRYLRPDLLAAAEVEAFDAWAATFGQTVTEIEMAPTGGGNYRQQTRFARFQNVPEMLRMWHVFADVKTAEDLNLPTPELTVRDDGKRAAQTVVIPPSEEIIAYVQSLADRAEAVRSRDVTPEEDNMLAISTDGRMAALDLRMVGMSPSSPSKIDVAAERIAAIWREHRDRTYLDVATGLPSPTPGALQLVFCDLGTPSEGWNAYDELRDQLMRRGVPGGQVRFVHEAKTDRDKARLFAAARSGDVAVLVGSTLKMGVGTNIQARAVALHHLDCPWRPADVEQREGRILRQGNQNAEVSIYRYVVERSFDAYSWQTVERKARFIAQVMRGRLDVREIEDIGDSALSFAEVKALASGDPLILEKARADAELTRLERLERAFRRSQDALAYELSIAEDRARFADRNLQLVHAAIDARTEAKGDAFEMTVLGRRVTSRREAADLIATWTASKEYWVTREPLTAQLGHLGGLPIDITISPDHNGKTLSLSLRDIPAKHAVMPVNAVLQGKAIGVIQALERRIADLPALAKHIAADGARAATARDEVKIALQQPFKYEDALVAARARSADILAALESGERDRIPHDSTLDSLAGYRELVGEARWALIEIRAAALAREEAGRDMEWWRRTRDQIGDPFAHLDRAVAGETLLVEGAQERALEVAREADTVAAELEQRAKRASRWSQRDERRDLLEAASVQRQIAARSRKEFERLIGVELQVFKDGCHLSDWMAVDGGRTALYVAAERKLVSERKAAIDKPERAPSDTRDRVRDQERDPARDAPDVGVGVG